MLPSHPGGCTGVGNSSTYYLLTQLYVQVWGNGSACNFLTHLYVQVWGNGSACNFLTQLYVQVWGNGSTCYLLIQHGLNQGVTEESWWTNSLLTVICWMFSGGSTEDHPGPPGEQRPAPGPQVAGLLCLHLLSLEPDAQHRGTFHDWFWTCRGCRAVPEEQSGQWLGWVQKALVPPGSLPCECHRGKGSWMVRCNAGVLCEGGGGPSCAHHTLPHRSLCYCSWIC